MDLFSSTHPGDYRLITMHQSCRALLHTLPSVFKKKVSSQPVLLLFPREGRKEQGLTWGCGVSGLPEQRAELSGSGPSAASRLPVDGGCSSFLSLRFQSERQLKRQAFKYSSPVCRRAALSAACTQRAENRKAWANGLLSVALIRRDVARNSSQISYSVTGFYTETGEGGGGFTSFAVLIDDADDWNKWEWNGEFRKFKCAFVIIYCPISRETHTSCGWIIIPLDVDHSA